MLRFLIINVLIIFTCLQGVPQASQKVLPGAARKLEKVKTAIAKYNWVEAKSLSDKLVDQYPTWTEAWKIYSRVYQEAGETAKSEKALYRLVALDSTRYPEAYRWIAEWSFNKGNYTVAASNFDKFINLTPDTSGLSYRIKQINSSIRFAQKQVENFSGKMPEKLRGLVNTDDDEYFPSLSVDGSMLAFTRQVRLTESVSGNNRQEELLYSSWSDSGYGVPVAFPYPINTDGNEGTQSLSQDGRIMFFTACNRPDTKGGCDIYYSVKSGDRWTDPINVGYPVNTRYWESTPFLAQDGEQLFFASNRPGGYGGMDIWKSTLQADRSWSNPKNMGPSINSPLDEMSPVLLVDGKTLFFASNGHIGLGGFDLYKCDLSNLGKASVPENLGFGINTFHDEDALAINADSHLGLFASNRDSAAGKDIYVADFSCYMLPQSTFSLSGIVRDRTTRLPVAAKIEVQPHGDSLISRAESDPVTGSYLLGTIENSAFRIGASAAGYLPYSCYYIRDSLMKGNRINHAIDLEPIRAGAFIVLQNTFFAFNSYEILPESKGDMDEILFLFRENPGIKIEISGFTDNSGTDEYNLRLSQKRAESVLGYLIRCGINPDQLSAKGYGKTNPVASNETEEGRRLNRRTEMKIKALN